MKLSSRDIHCHILPGLDDGFRNEADSLQAIRRMAEAGCRDIVFTPHLNPDVYPDMTEEQCRDVYRNFRSRIPEEWGVTTSLAAEYMVVAGFEDRVADSPETLLRYADGSILIEMSYYFRSKNLEKAIFELNMAGFKPILAHPERYLYMADRLEDFDNIVRMGCRLQMNRLSLTGAYGPASMKILNHLLKNGMYSFIATDLHSLAQLDSILGFRPGFLLRRRMEKLSSIEN